jgi:DNA polymerase family A
MSRSDPAAKELSKKIAKVRTKLKQVGDSFDWHNENHWRWLLFADAGLGLIPTRVSEKTGTPGVKKEDIEQLQKLYPDCEILQWRVDLKDAGRRKDLFQKLVPDIEGRVRFAFAIHRTENGRFSSGLDEDEEDKIRESQGGNAQNITKKDREIFVAPPGYVWIDLDMKQVELRVMAWLAGEWDLIRLLLAGGDIHSENGAAIFGCTPEEARGFKVWFGGKADTARQGGKKGSHSWDYGAGAKKTGDTFRPWQGRSFEEMMEFLFSTDLTKESYARRLKAAERSAEPEIETKKLRMRLFEMANTITAKGWIAAYFRRWKMLAEFQKVITRKVDEERELRNSFGRVLQFWNFRFDYDLKKWFCSDREEALAFWPASDVGDMAKVLLPLISADATRFGGQLVTTTHDSFSCLIRDDYQIVSEFIKTARKTMERVWPQYREHPEFGKFFVPADVSIGLNWGEFNSKSNPGGQREWQDGCGEALLNDLKAVRRQTEAPPSRDTSQGTESSAPTV